MVSYIPIVDGFYTVLTVLLALIPMLAAVVLCAGLAGHYRSRLLTILTSMASVAGREGIVWGSFGILFLDVARLVGLVGRWCRLRRSRERCRVVLMPLNVWSEWRDSGSLALRSAFVRFVIPT
jgi:hypothetical protein